VSALREARIDLAAISRNVETIRRAVGGAEVMVVVKANGYGHGAVHSARAALAGGATRPDTANVRPLIDTGPAPEA
jgi:alanine racemase